MPSALDLDWHSLHFGDVPTWVAAITAVVAVGVAVVQLKRQLEPKEKKPESTEPRSIPRVAEELAVQRVDRRHQAQELSAWYAGDNLATNETIMCVVNHSRDPVHNAVACLIIAEGAGPKKGEDYKAFDTASGIYEEVFRTILVVPPGKWSVTFLTTWRGMHRQPGFELAFTDSTGLHWIRRSTGELEQIDSPPIDYYGIGRPPSYAGLQPIKD